MSNFSLLDTLNGSRWDTSANNINTVGYVSCNGGTAVGTYYSNNGSAFRVPNGPTSSRPSGLTGYLRFNTDSCYNCLEYYDPLSALWTPIYPIPTITSITPDYVTDTSGAAGYYNTNPLIISGYGYVPGCTVSYRGTDSSVYAAPSTTYISNIQLRATVPASVYNGYNQDPFTIIVTNPTGVSGFLLNALDVDPSASWVTPAGAITNSLGGTTVDSSFTLTTTSSPYFRVQAIDLESLPLTYNSPDLSSNSATSNLSIDTSGGYGYIVGKPYSLSSATVSFTINALDGRTVVPRNFSLTVNAALRTANVSSAFAYQITYTNSSGLLPVTTGPYPNGYTVYTFNPNASSQVLVPTAQSSADTYQTAVATYTFTPLFTSSTIAALIVGGGGMGAGDGYSTTTGNGGGGGGGYYSNIGGAGLTMTSGTTYTVTVGAGGYAGAVTAANRRGGAGSSIIGGAISQSVFGGGGGGFWTGNAGQTGGSGGGGAGNALGGSGTGGQGNNGAAGSGPGGGGGGAGAAGSGANGGNGIANSISGISVTYAGGGGGSGGGSGGAGGGSAGAPVGNAGLTAAQMTPAVGGDGLGGGSGAQVGSGTPQASGGLAGVVSRGGSGVVIIRFLSYSG